jgi:hypothetical protein
MCSTCVPHVFHFFFIHVFFAFSVAFVHFGVMCSARVPHVFHCVPMGLQGEHPHNHFYTFPTMVGWEEPGYLAHCTVSQVTQVPPICQGPKKQYEHFGSKLRVVCVTSPGVSKGPAMSGGMEAKYSPGSTKDGYLPPWEVAKAQAYAEVIQEMASHMSIEPSEAVGKRVDDFIAERLTLKGGGNPTPRAVRKVLKRCADKEWYPGKPPGNKGGRPAVFTQHTQEEVARVAMDLKRQNLAPTPRRVRARLPRKTLNPDTGGHMSDEKVRTIFRTICYDADEDDPWVYMPCLSQDFLPDALKPLRVACGKHIQEHFAAGAWAHQVAIDPCSTLLPKTLERLQQMEVAAMGKNKWMSKGSARDGNNLRANHPCLRTFDRASHRAIVFDDVGSAGFVVSNKKVLQAHMDGATLGQSPTQTLTYSVWLWQVPMMITTNDWNTGDMDPHDADWLQENCVVHTVTAPVWR